MKNIQIDSLTLTDAMVAELTNWYNPNSCETTPDVYVQYLDHTKDTLIRLLCQDNEKFDAAIKESLSGIIVIQDSLKRLIPEDN